MDIHTCLSVCTSAWACASVCVSVSQEDLQDKRQPHLFHCHRVFNTDQMNMTFGISGRAHVINPDITNRTYLSECVHVCVLLNLKSGRIYLYVCGANLFIFFFFPVGLSPPTLFISWSCITDMLDQEWLWKDQRPIGLIRKGNQTTLYHNNNQSGETHICPLRSALNP